MNKSKLISLGWTKEKLTERLVSCRQYQKEYKQKEKEWNKSLWTYRVLNANLYRNYKDWLAVIVS